MGLGKTDPRTVALLDRHIKRRQKRLHRLTYRIPRLLTGLCPHCGKDREQVSHSLCNACLRKAALRRMKNYKHKLGPRIKLAPETVFARLAELYPQAPGYWLPSEVAAVFTVSRNTIQRQCREGRVGRKSKREAGARGAWILTKEDVIKLCNLVSVPTYDAMYQHRSES